MIRFSSIIAYCVFCLLVSNGHKPDFEYINKSLKEAEMQGLDPVLVASIGYRETRWDYKSVGALGECGPYQIMGWFTRPKLRCSELQDARVSARALRRTLDRWQAHCNGLGAAKPASCALHCYASGEACASIRSVRKLSRIRVEILRILFDSTVGLGPYRDDA